MEPHAGGVALSCQRSEEIDWAAFLHNPRDGVFRAFRAHYPGCAECAAQVRVWTELLTGVTANAGEPAHPTPEELERFDREPGELDAARSDFIAAHLQRCAACAEELHLLRGYNPVAIADAAAAAPPTPRVRGRWRRLLWNPALGLVLVGALLFPLIFRSAGPGETPGAIQPEGTAATELDADLAPARDATRERNPPPAGFPGLAAQRTPRQTAAEPAAKLSRSELSGRQADDAPARRPSATPRSEAPAIPAPGVEGGSPPPSPALPDRSATAAAPRPAEALRDQRARSPSKSEDPLAHHIWIPTMRLRPGQKSSGPASELRNGFFLEVPLPRNAPEGEARVLILPDAPFAKRAERGSPAPLAAERRALDALARPEADPVDGQAQGFEERVAVEAMQRALLLQVPPETLSPGVYQVDLELYRDGVIRGRGRFRLELVAE